LRWPAVKRALPSLHRFDLYRARNSIGLSAICPLRAALTAILIGTGLGGCSIMRSDDGPFAKMEGGDVTGSITPQVRPANYDPTEADLALARNAASDVLTKGSRDSSQPWENPATGARGSVTPLSSAYVAEGKTCRDFLASYVNGTTESWMQGAACKGERGRWDVRTLVPWKRS
jgi:surface antigen